MYLLRCALACDSESSVPDAVASAVTVRLAESDSSKHLNLLLVVYVTCVVGRKGVRGLWDLAQRERGLWRSVVVGALNLAGVTIIGMRIL
jgi:hypothetical protein